MNNGEYLQNDGTFSASKVTHTASATTNPPYTVTINSVPLGEYTIAEEPATVQGYTLTTTFTDASENPLPDGKIVVNGNTSVTVTNKYTPKTTSFTFGKLWVGLGDNNTATMEWPRWKMIRVQVRRRNPYSRETDKNFFQNISINIPSDQEALVTTLEDNNYGTYPPDALKVEILPAGSFNHYLFRVDGLVEQVMPGDVNQGEWVYYATELDQPIDFYHYAGTVDADDGASIVPGKTEVKNEEYFINKLKPNLSLSIPVKKKLTGRNVKADEFTFGLYSGNTRVGEVTTKENNPTMTLTLDSSHPLDISDLRYNSATKKYTKTFEYTVRGEVPATKVNGVTYDTTAFNVQVAATVDWNDGSSYCTLTSAGKTVNSDNPVTFANRYNAGSVSKTVKKVWDDGGNQDGVRPRVKLVLTAKADGQVVNSACREVVVPATGNSFTHTFTGLPKYEDSVEIAYTLSEEALTDGDQTNLTTYYNSEINGLTATNRHTPEKIDATFVKVWEDANDQDGKRPRSLRVTLWADDREAKNSDPDRRQRRPAEPEPVDRHRGEPGPQSERRRYQLHLDRGEGGGV